MIRALRLILGTPCDKNPARARLYAAEANRYVKLDVEEFARFLILFYIIEGYDALIKLEEVNSVWYVGP